MSINQRSTQMHPKPPRSAGFTIIELMIATSIFAIILLVVAIGVISFTNSYYKGIVSSKTQATARSIMAALTESIQFGQSVTFLSGNGGVQGVCIDNTLYSYKIGQEVVDSSPQQSLHQDLHGLVASINGDCSAQTPSLPASLPSYSRELLGPHMRLNDLSIIPSGRLYTIHLRVIYGEDDLLYPDVISTTDFSSPESCAGGRAGEQFCAVSDLTTTVEQRL